MSSFLMPTLACGTWCYAVYVAWLEVGPVAAIPALIAAAIGIGAPLYRRQIIDFVRRHRQHA